MIENEKKLKDVLAVLNDEGILCNVILIGSWCLLFYKKIFSEFDPLIRTTDIDFYVPDAKRIKDKNGLVKSLKNINYDMIHDSLTNKTSFISPDGFELEFLTRLNRDNLACVKLGNTDIFAESLSYVEIFSGNYIEINYDDLNVKLASPASYVLQKLLISANRKEKREKDIESIKHVLNYVKVSKKYNNELIDLYNSLPKKWKARIKNNAMANGISFDAL